MPKSKVGIAVQVGQKRLVDADAVGEFYGFTGKWVSEQAAAGNIPWHGIRNGAKVFRRFDLEEVRTALSHPVAAISDDNAQIANREVVAPPVRQRRNNRKPPRTAAAPAARTSASAAAMEF